MIQFPRSVLITLEDKRFYQENILYADSTFFDLFDYPFLYGDPHRALVNPGSVVMTAATAQKYFGPENPVGKTVRWNNEDSYHITGVLRPLKEPSHLNFDMLVSHVTLNSHPTYRNYIDNPFAFMTYNYLLLQEGTGVEHVNERIAAIIDKHLGDDMKAMGADLHYLIQPVTGIHLHSNLIHEITENGNVATIWIFSGIALLILVTACINFVNLTIAKSSFRALEVGIKKIFGAGRSHLVVQFLSETVVITLISLVIAIIAVKLLVPVISMHFSISVFIPEKALAHMVPALIAFGVLVALLAGLYPAFFLSAFRPVYVMRGNLLLGKKRPVFRNAMVALTFLITIFLINNTLIIYQQLRYLNRSDPGFDIEGMIVTPLRNPEMVRGYELIRKELSQIPGVEGITGFSSYPGNYQQRRGYYPEGQPSSNMWMIRNVQVDYNFLSLMGIRLEGGRDFSPTVKADSNAILVNRALAGKMGWDDPMGKHINLSTEGEGGGQRFVIVGLTDDFHYASLRNQVEPLIIHLDPANYRFIGIKVSRNDPKNTIGQITEKWEALFPGYPFDYFFLKEKYEQQYASESRMAGVFRNFTYLAVIIACLGLFGLVSFMINRRTREIGIRKVLGAETKDILLLFNADFLYMILFAAAISLPLSVMAMSGWLRNFAFHVRMGWWNLALSILITALIAGLIVSITAFGLARKNPSTILKYE
jgi:putative ABC transport system permease protein